MYVDVTNKVAGVEKVYCVLQRQYETFGHNGEVSKKVNTRVGLNVFQIRIKATGRPVPLQN